MDRDWIASFLIRFRNGTCIIILDKMYNIANSSCHFGSYGSIRTGPSPNKYYMDLSFGPYNICLVTDRFIYCHMHEAKIRYFEMKNQHLLLILQKLLVRICRSDYLFNASFSSRYFSYDMFIPPYNRSFLHQSNFCGILRSISDRRN
jgi:hypothetical protein